MQTGSSQWTKLSERLDSQGLTGIFPLPVWMLARGNESSHRFPSSQSLPSASARSYLTMVVAAMPGTGRKRKSLLPRPMKGTTFLESLAFDQGVEKGSGQGERQPADGKGKDSQSPSQLSSTWFKQKVNGVAVKLSPGII